MQSHKLVSDSCQSKNHKRNKVGWYHKVRWKWWEEQSNKRAGNAEKDNKVNSNYLEVIRLGIFAFFTYHILLNSNLQNFSVQA